VLVVDDDADTREALSTLLALWGYRVEVAADGEQAITLTLDRRPDVVLVDIVMPGLDGYEVARRIRAAPGGQAPYLVALTGMGRAEDPRSARAAGFDTYMLKPADTNQLQELLASPRCKRRRGAHDRRGAGTPTIPMGESVTRRVEGETSPDEGVMAERPAHCPRCASGRLADVRDAANRWCCNTCGYRFAPPPSVKQPHRPPLGTLGDRTTRRKHRAL